MIRTTFGAACAIAVATCASAQSEELALSHWVPPTHVLQPTGMEPWADSIREASNGEIDISIYPSQQLGAAPDHYDMTRDGIVDIGFINPGYQPGRLPIVSVAELPFLFSNATGGSEALHEWYLDYAEQEMSDVFVCMMIMHHPGTLHSTVGPMEKPEDVRGRNVRPAHGTQARMVNMLGGGSVQVPAPEMHEMISRGGAEMAGSPWYGLYLFDMLDELTHHLDLPLYTAQNLFVINKQRLAAMSDENRQVMMDHCTPEWSRRMATGWAEVEVESLEKLRAEAEAGERTFYVPSEEQRQAWRDVAQPLAEEWKAAVAAQGIDGDAALDALRERLRAHDALAE